MKDLVQRLRVFSEQFVGKEAAAAKQAADLLEQQSERLASIYSQPVELPEKKIIDTHLPTGVAIRGYTADQLARAVQEATARALEAAARECDARYMGDNNREDMEARRCATAIRNLIGGVK